jgi:hypothetical protein
MPRGIRRFPLSSYRTRGLRLRSLLAQEHSAAASHLAAGPPGSERPVSCPRKASLSRTTSAALQAARLLTSDIRIPPATGRVKLFMEASNLLACGHLSHFIRSRGKPRSCAAPQVSGGLAFEVCNTSNSHFSGISPHATHSHGAVVHDGLWRSRAVTGASRAGRESRTGASPHRSESRSGASRALARVARWRERLVEGTGATGGGRGFPGAGG